MEPPLQIIRFCGGNPPAFDAQWRGLIIAISLDLGASLKLMGSHSYAERDSVFRVATPKVAKAAQNILSSMAPAERRETAILLTALDFD